MQPVEIGPGSHKCHYHNFGVQDGLPASLSVRLYRDGRGRLWLSTLKGGYPATTARNSLPIAMRWDRSGAQPSAVSPGSTRQGVVQNNPDVDPTYFNGGLFQVLPKACKLAYTFLEDQNGDL